MRDSPGKGVRCEVWRCREGGNVTGQHYPTAIFYAFPRFLEGLAILIVSSRDASSTSRTPFRSHNIEATISRTGGVVVLNFSDDGEIVCVVSSLYRPFLESGV